MKCTIPEISWHNKDPVLSVDIQCICEEEFFRLASGGSDCHVLIWHLKIQDNGAVSIDIASDLKRHQKAVNVVRWSPSGKHLATGDDDSNIIIWNLKTDNIPLLEGESCDKEIWLVTKILRGHKEDIYDISWSPNGLKLISGSIDNTAIVWDFSKGTSEQILFDHKGFVQGVTWDPKGQYIATLSSDRICRLFDNTGKYVKARIHKGYLPVSESHELFNKEIKYFHDDTFKSYFRRLTFSPDGNLLIVPSGNIEFENYKGINHATFIFTLDSLTHPVAVLPSTKQITIAARCCPILFELRCEGTNPLIQLPYRIIIAIATDSDIILYDTQQQLPFAHFQKIHYTRITDLTWSLDGRLLIASSTDGFCTLITFESNELGTPYVKQNIETQEDLLETSGCEDIDKNEESINIDNKGQNEIKPKKPNILEQWALQPNISSTPKISSTLASQEKVLLKEKLLKTNSNCTMPTRKRIIPIKIADIQNKNIEKQNTSRNLVQSDKHQIDDCKSNAQIDLTVDADHDKDIIVEDVCRIDNKISNTQITENVKCKEHKGETKKNRTSTILNFFQVSDKKMCSINVPAKCLNNSTNITKDKLDVETILIEDDSNHSICTDTRTSNSSINKENSNDNVSFDKNCDKSDTEELSLNKSQIIKMKNAFVKVENLKIDVNNFKPDVNIAENFNAELYRPKKVEEPKDGIKIPRRVPFITLSSPKRKKKE